MLDSADMYSMPAPPDKNVGSSSRVDGVPNVVAPGPVQVVAAVIPESSRAAS